MCGARRVKTHRLEIGEQSRQRGFMHSGSGVSLRVPCWRVVAVRCYCVCCFHHAKASAFCLCAIARVPYLLSVHHEQYLVLLLLLPCKCVCVLLTVLLTPIDGENNGWVRSSCGVSFSLCFRDLRLPKEQQHDIIKREQKTSCRPTCAGETTNQLQNQLCHDETRS